MLALQCMQYWPSAEFFPPSHGGGSGLRWTLFLRRCIERGYKWKDAPLLQWSATALLLPHFNNYEWCASNSRPWHLPTMIVYQVSLSLIVR